MTLNDLLSQIIELVLRVTIVNVWKIMIPF